MLYALLCVLILVTIIKLLGLEWIYSIITLLVLTAIALLVWNLYSEQIISFALGIGVLAVAAIILLILRDKGKIKDPFSLGGLANHFSKNKKEKGTTSRLGERLRNENNLRVLLGNEDLVNKVENRQVGTEEDSLYEMALKEVREAGRASPSFLQRKLSISYERAARLIELLAKHGVIEHGLGAKPHNLKI